MKKTMYLLYVVGAIQIVLGIFHLFAPEFFLKNTGHSIPEADIYYPIAMLASRFIAYGIALIYIAKNAQNHTLWIWFMILIQAIDLGAGIFYTATGVVPIADSAFPMFNATWIMVLLFLWMPKQQSK
jgi:hypothetical protein